jgi:glucosamine--fructose-6-phosphate aminotransferase (isomerizing)
MPSAAVRALGQLPENLERIFAIDYSASFESISVSRTIHLIGMGASYNSALAVSAQFKDLGLKPMVQLASDAQVQGVESLEDDELVLLISHTGESQETVAVAEQLAGSGHEAIAALTNTPDSRLARTCTVVCPTLPGRTLQHALGVFASSCLCLSRLASWIGAAGVPEHAETPSVREEAERALCLGRDLAGRFPVPPTTVDVLARGAACGIANQAALIFREYSRTPASSWETGNFRHGPIETVDAHSLVLLYVAGQPKARDFDAAFARRLQAVSAASVVIGPAGTADADFKAPPPFDSVISLIPVVYLAYSWAEAIGLVPGELRFTSRGIEGEA